MSRNPISAGNIVFDCHYHVVWCTKYRLPLLKDGADERLKEIVTDVALEMGADIDEVEVRLDHIHILLTCHPDYVCKIARAMKGRSSRLLRKEFPFVKSRTPSLWTRSYFVATSGEAPLSAIKKYISNQKKRRK